LLSDPRDRCGPRDNEQSRDFAARATPRMTGKPTAVRGVGVIPTLLGRDGWIACEACKVQAET
jgi:hypothetical protein